MKALLEQLKQMIPDKIPLVAFMGAEFLEVDADHALVKMPFHPQNRNHLNSMYFGALAIGGELAGGLLALYHIFQTQKPVALVFKDFSATFLKRAEEDVYFSCVDGTITQRQIAEMLATGDRVSFPVSVRGFVQKGDDTETVAEFKLTISLKLQGQAEY